MSAFMEQLGRDIDSIFLNQDEFATMKRIGTDGRLMPVVIDTHKLAELKAKSQYAEELYNAELLLFVKPGDLGYRPAKGGRLRVEDDVYTVVEVTGELLYRIILEAVQ